MGKGHGSQPGMVFLTIFGTPAKSGSGAGAWEGHHLSLNSQSINQCNRRRTRLSSAPTPATVKQGRARAPAPCPRQRIWLRNCSSRWTTANEDCGFRKSIPEVAGQTRAPRVGEPRGIAYAKLETKQRQLLLKLIRSYAARMPEDVAAAEMNEVEQGGPGQRLLCLRRRNGAGGASHLPRPRPKFCHRVLEQSGGFGPKPGQPYP